MYAMVRQFLERLGSGEELIEYSTGDKRIAMAVLLFRVVTADGKIRTDEMARYRQILQDDLDISPDEVALFERVVASESDAEHSLFPFTTIVSKMPVETKRHIIELMREISLADNELHEFEINLVTRTAELLGVNPED